MKKFKFFLGLIILLFVGVGIYQNQAFFFEKHALLFQFCIKDWVWATPEISIIFYWLGCLIIGLLITGFFLITSKLKSKKTIKSLNKTISSLKSELQTFKSDPYQNQETSEQEKTNTQEPKEESPKKQIQEKQDTE